VRCWKARCGGWSKGCFDRQVLSRCVEPLESGKSNRGLSSPSCLQARLSSIICPVGCSRAVYRFLLIQCLRGSHDQTRREQTFISPIPNPSCLIWWPRFAISALFGDSFTSCSACILVLQWLGRWWTLAASIGPGVGARSRQLPSLDTLQSWFGVVFALQAAAVALFKRVRRRAKAGFKRCLNVLNAIFWQAGLLR